MPAADAPARVMNLPNQLTLARMVMSFVFIGLMSFDHTWCIAVSLMLFIAATVTDVLDGRIARKHNLVTNFGKLLDPVADKILVTAAFVMLMRVPDLRVPGWTVVVILGREFLVTGVRSLAASEGAIIAANFWGKAKASLQMGFAIGALALVVLGRVLEAVAPGAAPWYGPALAQLSLWAAVVVALFTVYSGWQFFYMNRNALRLGGGG
jgi:CDP-diacylglycerol---glycerol-3-phosphate 3-phosphatidyltransferase